MAVLKSGSERFPYLMFTLMVTDGVPCFSEALGILFNWLHSGILIFSLKDPEKLSPEERRQRGMVAAIKYFKAYHGRRTEYEVGIPDCVPGVFFVGLSIAQNDLEAFMEGTLQCPFVRV